MSNFGGLVPTQAGLGLLAKALAGKELKFIRVACGDGRMPQGANKRDMTALVRWVRDLPIHSITVPKTTGANGQLVNRGTAVIKAVMSNEGLQQGFFFREIGLFARNPEGGQDVLYAYGNAGDLADYIPAGGPDMIQYLLSLSAVVDRAENITAVIAGGLVFVSQEELDERSELLAAQTAQQGAAIERVKFETAELGREASREREERKDADRDLLERAVYQEQRSRQTAEDIASLNRDGELLAAQIARGAVAEERRSLELSGRLARLEQN